MMRTIKLAPLRAYQDHRKPVSEFQSGGGLVRTYQFGKIGIRVWPDGGKDTFTCYLLGLFAGVYTATALTQACMTANEVKELLDLMERTQS